MADNSNYTYLDFHKPILEDGEYSVEISQVLNITGETVAPTDIPAQKLTFHVEGPRFDLDPSLVHSVYPPRGGKGDYQAVIPDLVLTRSTLPWERLPFAKQDDACGASWLFLLLIDQSEESNVQEKNNIDLSTIASYFSFDKLPSGAPDLSRSPSQINYLLVNSSFAKTIIPANLDVLANYSYARINTNDAGEEMAVLLCNRIPKKGSNSTIYLISLENNYKDANTFTGISDGSTNFVFPYLYKWKFHTFNDQLYCITDNIKLNDNYSKWPDISTLINDKVVYTTTEEIETTLNGVAGMSTTIMKQIKSACKLPGTTFHEVLSNLSGGFAPFCLNTSSNDIQSTGSVKLDFLEVEKTANGSIPLYSKAWYRGPLTGTNSLSNPFSSSGSTAFDNFPLNSGALFLGIQNLNINDGSYASAFELGKLTALADPDFCNEFYKWKNKAATALRVQQLSQQSSYVKLMHLSFSETTTVPAIPPHVLKKFNDWKQLIGIPYRYIVPDDALLPNESIRFFKVDKNWINAFIYGAFSIGKTVDADLTAYINGDSANKIPPLLMENDHYGFFVNSIVVDAWPDFEVDVTPSVANTPLNVVKRKLDVNILLCLVEVTIDSNNIHDVSQLKCDGLFTSLAFHLHPAKLHSGFLLENGIYYKLNKTVQATIDSNNIYDVSQLKTDLQTQYNLGNLSDPAEIPDTLINTMNVCDLANLLKEPTPEVVFNIG